jgi:hypothetical protein
VKYVRVHVCTLSYEYCDELEFVVVLVCTCMRMCTILCVHVLLHVSACVGVCVCGHVYDCVWSGVGVFVYLWVRVFVHMCLYGAASCTYAFMRTECCIH